MCGMSACHLRARGCAQVLPLPDMATAAPSTGPDGSVFVAARGNADVRRLVPVPFAAQVCTHLMLPQP